jgi:hypothetical protein
MICIIPNCLSTNIEAKEMCNKHYKNNWQKQNKEKRQIILKNYHNSKKHKDTHKKYHATVKGRYSYLKNSLKRYGKVLECTITLEQYEKLIENSCYYCSGPLFHSAYGAGLDRIDNSLGYHVNNVLPCCGECNKLRSNRLSVSETVEVIKLLKKFRKTDLIWSTKDL